MFKDGSDGPRAQTLAAKKARWLWERECLSICFGKMARKMDKTKKLSNAELASLKQTFLDWFAKTTQKELNILITGKTGVGKSRLVNALVGRSVAKEGRERKACTDDVTSYRVEIDGIKVLVWDSPGLQDGTDNDELYFAKLVDKLKHGFDVMIYCIKMEDKRFYPEDKTAIQKLTMGFGKDMWKKAVIALTFANKIEDPDEGDDLAYFMGEMYFWEKEIDDFFTTKLHVDRQVRSALPIAPAGNYKKLRLPSCDYWLAALWSKCLSVMTHSAGLALYQINKNRLKFSCSEDMAAACSSQSRKELPTTSDASQSTDDMGDIPREIPLNEKQENTFLSQIWAVFTVSGTASIATVITFAVLKVLFRR